MNIKENRNFKNHIHINLNAILQALFPATNISPQYSVDTYLTEEQAELLAFIEMGDYERVEIKLKNKKMEMLEGTERIDTRKRIVDILKENKFQTITVKQADGKIASIVRKTKKKLNS